MFGFVNGFVNGFAIMPELTGVVAENSGCFVLRKGAAGCNPAAERGTSHRESEHTPLLRIKSAIVGQTDSLTESVGVNSSALTELVDLDEGAGKDERTDPQRRGSGPLPGGVRG